MAVVVVPSTERSSAASTRTPGHSGSTMGSFTLLVEPDRNPCGRRSRIMAIALIGAS
jgi:hypothetical protein